MRPSIRINIEKTNQVASKETKIVAADKIVADKKKLQNMKLGLFLLPGLFADASDVKQPSRTDFAISIPLIQISDRDFRSGLWFKFTVRILIKTGPTNLLLNLLKWYVCSCAKKPGAKAIWLQISYFD